MDEQELLTRLEQSPKPTSYAEFAELLQSLEPELAVKTELPEPAILAANKSSGPPGFPPNIHIKQTNFNNWCQAIELRKAWIAYPQTPDDVVAIANWAKEQNKKQNQEDKKFRLRASGHSHNWSPLVVTSDVSSYYVVLVDTSTLNRVYEFDRENLTATFDVGTTIEQATDLLQKEDNQGASNAPGYSWQNFTAPGAMSLGGVLAIGGHGTSIPYDNHPQPLAGCLSNLIVSFKAVVTDPNGTDPDSYVIKEFHRSDTDAAAFLVHLGRAFLTEVTMKVIPNYYLEVVNSYPKADDLFQDPSQPLSDNAIAKLLDRYGRVEVIWFPFTDEPWIKTWETIPEPTKTPVSGPYNYPWANNITLTESNLIKAGLFLAPAITPTFGRTQLSITKSNAVEGESGAMQGTARDLLLYVQDNTLRVTACGYAIQLRRDQVQEAAYQFYVKYQQLLQQYQQASKYPINGPVEIRWTTVDFTDDLGIQDVQPPALSACHSVQPHDQTLDTVFWVDALTLPSTKFSNEFFVELETWIKQQWGTAANNVGRPEWSKGWAYTSQGGWTNETIITSDIPAHYNQPQGTNTFTWATETLTKYDQHHIYTNKFLDQLLPG
ncbi:hypothetical protein NIES4103_14020 [Nostoc sp. NIES-4103]|nr:hypothetical protein NIES4103_14020 [Nostoc sp. NIES-4103]